MNNEKIKEIEDFSKGMWLNYGCKVAKEIPNRQFLMIKTSHANSILNGLSLSGIQFSAKYDERNLMLYYSLNDKIKVKEILNKAKLILPILSNNYFLTMIGVLRKAMLPFCLK